MPDYECDFDLLLPGNSKKTSYTIHIKDAENPTDALMKGIAEWKRVVEPRDVRVREIPPSLVKSPVALI